MAMPQALGRHLALKFLVLSAFGHRGWEGINRLRGALSPNSHLSQDTLLQPAVGAERKQRQHNRTSKEMEISLNLTLFCCKQTPSCYIQSVGFWGFFFPPKGSAAHWDRLRSNCGACLSVVQCVVHITETKARFRLKNSNTLEAAVLTEVQRLTISSVSKTHPCLQAPRAERKGRTHSSAPRTIQTITSAQQNIPSASLNLSIPYLSFIFWLAPSENRSLLVHRVIA